MVQIPHGLEHTKLLRNGFVFHYTCNAPSIEVLNKHNISAIGREYGCENPTEVLLIPKEIYSIFNFQIKGVDEESLKIITEQLLARLK